MKSSYNAYYNNKLCLKYVLNVKKFSHPLIPSVYSATKFFMDVSSFCNVF